MIPSKRQYVRDIAGSIVPLTALILPVIVGMAGLGIDASMWMMEKRNLQSAADAAVISGAWEVANGEAPAGETEDYAEQAAYAEASNNGYSGDHVVLDFDTNPDGNTTVGTTLSQDSHSYFASFLYGATVHPTVEAAAEVVPVPGDFCFLSLDPSADGAITVSGSVDVDSAGCGLAINSSSSTSLIVHGNPDVTVESVTTVGGLGGLGRDFHTALGRTVGAAKMPDPYTDLELPDMPADHPDGCTAQEVEDGPVNPDGSVPLEPGLYCGGLSFGSNNDYVMNPGVYILDGGDFEMTGSGSLTAEGVSIVLTNSGDLNDDGDASDANEYGSYGNIKITGGGEITLSAPDEGEDMEGISLYQDRNAPVSTDCNANKMLGNTEVTLTGAIYMPNQCLKMGGNHSSDAPNAEPCTRIITRQIDFAGNPNIGNNCAGTATKDISQFTVRLIL